MNYKKHFSIIWMAIVNANYEFLMVHVGTNGRASDAGLFSELEFFERLKKKDLGIPEAEQLPGYDPKMPYVLVADDAFPLMENIMKPYSHTTMKEEEIIFNYRLSRARRIVENVFGILTSRFRILLRTINLSPEKVTTIVLTCCYLHNYLRQMRDTQMHIVTEASIGQTISESANLDELAPTIIRNSSNAAKEIRDKFCHYFYTVGAVPWQNKMLGKYIAKMCFI